MVKPKVPWVDRQFDWPVPIRIIPYSAVQLFAYDTYKLIEISPQTHGLRAGQEGAKKAIGFVEGMLCCKIPCSHFSGRGLDENRSVSP
ncbi:hypothetical protein RHGRI_004909 [Rhododendron griersonianum]|uniref:Uncharacterized protein n=1 Tax=Rhododendron griersonianum TaxID=479676 RepID=A0AAV6LAD5_9ERIC|nr:hypothetical protein RHGRI_004909 [Rhododendron griersonianum]